MLAIFVWAQHVCRYWQTIHQAIAAHHLHGRGEFVVQVTTDPQRAPIPDKLQALLVIAGKITSFTSSRGRQPPTPPKRSLRSK